MEKHFTLLVAGVPTAGVASIEGALRGLDGCRIVTVADKNAADAIDAGEMPDLVVAERGLTDGTGALVSLRGRIPLIAVAAAGDGEQPDGQTPTFFLPDLTGLRETILALMKLPRHQPSGMPGSAPADYYAEFIDSLPQAVVEVDRNRRVIYANRFTYEFFGYTAEEAKAGIDIADFVLPSERQRFFEKVGELFAGQPTVGSEYTLTRRNKAPVRVLIHAVPIRRNGELAGFRAILIDITERMKAERALRRQEEKYRTLFENVNEAILIIDPETAVVLEANRRAEELYGFEPGTLRGVHLGGISHDAELRQGQLRELVKTGRTLEEEVVRFRKDGTALQLVSNASVIDFEGRAAVLSINKDVSGERRAAEMLRGIIDSSPLATVAIDAESRVILWSPAAERMFGWKADEVYGKPIPMIPPDRKEEFASLRRRLANGGVTKGFETVRWRKDGSRFDARVSNSALLRQDGSVAGYSAVIEDITEERRAQRRLRESEERFSKAFHTIPDAVTISRLSDGRLLEVNEGFTRLSGYLRKDIIGRTTAEISIWADAGQRKRLLEAVVSEGRVENLEVLFRARSGAVLVCLMSAALVEVENERCVLSVARNISARKEIEEDLRRREEKLEDTVRERTASLRQSEETFRALAENSDDVIMRFDRELRHLYVNPVVQHQTGIAPQDFIGKKHAELGFPIPLVNTWETALETVVRRKESHRVEFELPNHTWIDWLLIPEFQPNGEVVTVLATARDITRRKRTEEELVAHRDHLEELIVARTKEVEEANERLRKEITARTGVEAELRRSEEQFRFMAETTGDVLYRLDFRTQKYDYLSPAFARLTGYTPGEIHGRGFSSIVEKIELLQPHGTTIGEIRKFREGGFAEEYRADLLIRMKGGRLRWIHDHSFPWYDAAGNLLGSVGILHDISDRKRLEEHLAKVNECFLKFGDDSEENINLLTALCGELLEGSTALYNRLEKERLCSIGVWNAPEGYVRSDDPNGHICTDVIREAREDVCVIRNLGTTAYHQTDPNVAQYGLETYVGKAVKFGGAAIGSLCVVFTRDFNPTEEDRKLLGIVAAAIGVEEERNKARGQLRLQGAALESAANAIVITDPSGTVTWANRAIGKLTGYAPEEIEGRSTKLLKSGVQGRDFYETMWKTISGGRVWRGELVNKRKDGTLYSEEMTITPVLDAAGAITQYIAVKQDVTERKDLERQLLQSQKMQSLGTLAGGVAHDFNNLLGIILGYASLLDRSSADDAKRRIAAEAISRAAQRGADLVQQILTFARKSDLTFSETDVNKEIRSLGAMLLETFPKKVTLSLELDSMLPLVLIDRGRLQQALLNLTVNARDAMPEGGTLAIRTRRASGLHLQKLYHDETTASEYVEIEVSDTGSGMSEEVKSRIFEPFFTTKDKGKGTGLGLAVVYGVVQSHRGFISVESEPGAGTTFHLFFPSSSRFVESTEEKSEPAADVKGTETILVVEDEPLMLELLTENLREHGFTVITAGDGLEGVETFRQNADRIDLVLTDLGLPKLDGRQLIHQVLGMKPNAKVLLASGYLEPEVKNSLLGLGIKEILQKPYHFASLLRSVRGLLDAG